MLTLDEFLRETSQASAASNEAERHLQALLLVHRRGERERERRGDRDRDRERDLAPNEALWRRSLFDHTPAGRLRPGLGPGPGGAAAATTTATASYTPLPPAPGMSPATAGTGSPSPRPAAGTTSASAATTDRPGAAGGLDSFDTLVTHIRRIGALQDVMLNNVDSTTANLEDAVSEVALREAMAQEPEPEPTGPNRRDRNRSAVDSLRIREARLRAMQTRIDLLASEFALLRSTRRELRRVRQLPSYSAC